MEFSFDYVDFTNVVIKPQLLDSKKSEHKTYTSNNKNYTEYDETTTEQYRTYRLIKIDPIMKEAVPENLIFEFKYKWDPITGERSEIDDYGSLSFNAENLYHYYYTNRTNGLWYPPSEQFQGYYGDLLGCGKSLLINSRPRPEKYLYRLPVIDCYIKKTHDHSLITMGPILTDEEIDSIDKLISNVKKSNKPTLKTLKKYYDEAINDSPNISELKKEKPDLTDRELKELYNKQYVDKLLKL
jgi:hypothetical protein